MRPIDAHFATEQINNSDLPNHWKDALLSCLSSVPTIAPPPNDPLTLEELREMDGDPVWVELLPPTAGPKAGWALAYTDHGCSAAQQRWTNWTLWYDEYGKTWLAYRHKPEEGNFKCHC